jgi:hypothetical protein
VPTPKLSSLSYDAVSQINEMTGLGVLQYYDILGFGSVTDIREFFHVKTEPLT